MKPFDLEAAKRGAPAPHPAPVAQAVIDEMAERLLLIGNMAHDASTGPAIPDVLWEIRNLAYEHI